MMNAVELKKYLEEDKVLPEEIRKKYLAKLEAQTLDEEGVADILWDLKSEIQNEIDKVFDEAGITLNEKNLKEQDKMVAAVEQIGKEFEEGINKLTEEADRLYAEEVQALDAEKIQTAKDSLQ